MVIFLTTSLFMMKFVKQLQTLEISNIKLENPTRIIKHSSLLPNTIRCIICGPSNCGKTNAMLTLLLHENGLKFKHIYLYSKTNFQPKYRFLCKVMNRIPESQLFMFEDGKDVVHPNDALFNSVIIFDDVACENHANIRNYFSMGRHRQIDCFYLSQTYSKIPKQLLRDNVNLLLIFKQDDVNLKHIYNEHVNTDIHWDTFKKLCSVIWHDPFNFLLINKDCPLNEGRYRKGFDTFIYF